MCASGVELAGVSVSVSRGELASVPSEPLEYEYSLSGGDKET